MSDTIVIIDGNSLINRAYYAMQRPMITKSGLYTQGVYGFINMLSKIRTDYEPAYMAVAFDMKSPTFRHEEYKEYKAKRKKMPPELAMQLPLLKEVLGAMNIKMLECEGYEADDIIGTIAKKAEEEGMEPVIITGDKDELQLASDRTKVVITKKGVSEFEIYDRQAMIDKYGFTPEQFIDYKGLMGDQSDNIPGLPGVGEKTASKLMLEYGSVESIIEHADELKGKLAEKVRDNADLARMSKHLATIVTDVPMDVDFKEYEVREADHEKLVDTYVKLEFNSFLKKLGAEGAGDKTAKFEALKVEEIMISSPDDLDNGGSLAKDLKSAGFAVIKVFGDNNHVQMPVITGVSLLVNNKYYYVNGKDEEVIRKLVQILDDTAPLFMGHDIKSDYYMLKCYGLKECRTGFDTAVAQYVLDPGRSNYSMNAMSQEYFRETIEDEKQFMAGSGQMDMFDDRSQQFSDYGLKWCALSAQMMIIQKETLASEKLERVMDDVEIPLIEVMADMEYRGFAVDRKALERAGNDIGAKVEELTSKIYELAGEEFNIRSPQQLGVILFEKLGLEAGKRTKKGYSTNAETLEKIKNDHPIVPLIMEYRTLTKLTGTYIDGLIPLIAPDGRIHCHFNQTVTATGRISSSEPNMQNIPVRQELGRSLRKAFVPAEGMSLTGADYSQIELRVLAHMSKDPALIESFNNGEDIHKATAARVLGVPEDEITPEQRSRAKAVNFGIIYGMSAFGLSTEIKVSRKEAEEYIASYFAKHEAVKRFMDEQVFLCKQKGYVRTLLGRKRRISEISASNYMVRQLGERLAMNSPIQGSAADIIKIAMVKVYRALKNYESAMILQVHDELIIETAAGEEEAVSDLLRESMENAVELSVKLVADLGTGSNWFELK